MFRVGSGGLFLALWSALARSIVVCGGGGGGVQTVARHTYVLTISLLPFLFLFLFLAFLRPSAIANTVVLYG